MEITVQPAAGGWVCEVALEADGRRSHHTMTISAADLRRWGRGGEGAAAAEDLASRCFEFLLEREPARAILRRFDLSVIQRYFPDFDRMLRP
ncbi:MAG TPA: hypothetical protein VI172_07590 [Candidatus Dormibacteraeota bacterium]